MTLLTARAGWKRELSAMRMTGEERIGEQKNEIRHKEMGDRETPREQLGFMALIP